MANTDSLEQGYQSSPLAPLLLCVLKLVLGVRSPSVMG